VAVADLGDWLSEWLEDGSVWYLKRLSGNDTLANESHQAGPYIPKDILFDLFPTLHRPDQENPDLWIDAYIDSHSDHRKVRAIWYNNRLRGGTRNEARLTNWGGGTSALLDPESTGALAVFVFTAERESRTRELHVWVCGHPTEEDLVEERVAPVEPGEHLTWRPGAADVRRIVELAAGRAISCRLTAAQMPPGWLTVFPTGREIVDKVRELRPADGTLPDIRLIKRRDCEFEVFQSIEEAIEANVITHGFHSVAEFLTHAQRILQRRKARSGRSLELQTRAILMEQGFVEGQDFSHQPESDPGKRPDFLFPSGAAYRDSSCPADRLRMLAAKTTCKDRWRQVINEADRISVKHLLTLQEGVSTNQYAEMKAAGVRLVVPEPLTSSFPAPIRPELVSLHDFIESARHLAIVN
jgi:hypothetical protein